MKRLASILMLLGASACSPLERGSAAPVGRIYHYLRSNADGSEAEHVYVFRKARDQLEVYKMRERCTNAAFVTAEVDPATGEARRMTGGRLLPRASHRDFAELTFDPATRDLRAEVRLNGQVRRDSVKVEHSPWHLYDFDLASLTVATAHLADPSRGFSFGLPLVLVRLDPGSFLQYLGEARAEFVGRENRAGREALRFEVGGSALRGKGGPLWIDAEEGHILEARWGVPNHAEYRDFHLRLLGTDSGGAAWTALLTRHFEGCAHS